MWFSPLEQRHLIWGEKLLCVQTVQLCGRFHRPGFTPSASECWQETRGRCQVVETRLSKTNFQGMYSHSQGWRGSWKTWNSIYVRWDHLFVCDSLTYHGALHLNQEAPEVRFQTLKVWSTSSARLIPLSTSVTAVKHTVGTSVLFVSHQIRAAHSSVPRLTKTNHS